MKTAEWIILVLPKHKVWKTQVKSLSTKTLKPIKRCFGLGFRPSWINPTGPCHWTYALTQKGRVGCVNNGEGGNTCGPHGFLSVERAIGGVLSAFDYWCQLGNCACFVLQVRVLLSSKHSKSRVLSFGQSATPSLFTQITDHSGLTLTFQFSVLTKISVHSILTN